MKHFISIIIFISFCLTNHAQSLSQKEDSLKKYAKEIVMGRTALDRFKADSIFTRLLVKALKTPNSFYHPFDSLITISKLYAPDSTFKIFTWQMVINENLTRQHGAIQMKTSDGSLKLFPLIDKSDVTESIADTAANNKGWIGAVYYKIILTSHNNKKYYTLIGYDENNMRSTRKIIEVLYFANDEPNFGGKFFSYASDSIIKPTTSRYILEFKKEAGARLTYDEDLKMIIAEHLESETNEPNKKWTYIPDGDYEGFIWKFDQWVHKEKIFTQVTAEGSEPVPVPLNKTTPDLQLDKIEEMPAEKTVKPTPKKKGGG